MQPISQNCLTTGVCGSKNISYGSLVIVLTVLNHVAMQTATVIMFWQVSLCMSVLRLPGFLKLCSSCQDCLEIGSRTLRYPIVLPWYRCDHQQLDCVGQVCRGTSLIVIYCVRGLSTANAIQSCSSVSIQLIIFALAPIALLNQRPTNFGFNITINTLNKMRPALICYSIGLIRGKHWFPLGCDKHRFLWELGSVFLFGTA